MCFLHGLFSIIRDTTRLRETENFVYGTLVMFNVTTLSVGHSGGPRLFLSSCASYGNLFLAIKRRVLSGLIDLSLVLPSWAWCFNRKFEWFSHQRPVLIQSGFLVGQDWSHRSKDG